MKDCFRFPMLTSAAFLAALVSTSQLSAQDAAAAKPAASEVVVLSPFTVSSANTTRYQATESTSGTRARVPLFEATQSVSVVTRDLIEDISAGRVVEAAKYVAGVYESTIPNAQDRTTIRGFQNDGATMDGFSYFSFANADPVLIDRIEVVKGPNAIMAPQGVPGGTVNLVSKKPIFADRGSISAQAGLYSSTRSEIDVNRVVTPGKLAVRVVGSAQDADDYGDHNFHQGFVVMPMMTYRFGATTELTVQVEAYNWRALNFGGIPISLYANSTNHWNLLESIPRDFIVQRDDVTRHQSGQHYRAFFTTSFSENLSMRIAANLIESKGRSGQLNIGAAVNQVVTVDPATGLTRWDGTTRNDAPLFTLGGSINEQDRTYANFQNDFIYEVKTDTFKSTTVAGWAANFAATYNEKNQNFTVPSPQNLTNFVYSPYTLTNVTGVNTRFYRDQQIYLNETLGFLNERLQLTGGVSRDWYYSENKDVLRGIRGHVAPDATLPSGGVVFKLTQDLAVYYGFSKQTSAINPTVTATSTNTNLFSTQTSKQHEFGLRARLLNNRLTTSLAYFDIKQNNFSIPNPANSANPVPSPLLPPLFSDRLAHGVELEFNFAVNQNFSLIGNGTAMRNRDANGIAFRGTAEKSGALWANYTFSKNGSLSGLSVGIGADYLSKRAGDAASGVTSTSTSTNIIRVQPSFWLSARTLVNASVVYRMNSHWRGQLNLDNLLDEDYLQSATGRTNVWPGTPFNAKLTLTYLF
jgi:iron complex outermembrane recepter protein